MDSDRLDFLPVPRSFNLISFPQRHGPLFGHHWYLVHLNIAFPLLASLPVLAHQFAPSFLRLVPRRHLGLSLGVLTGLVLLLNIVIVSPAKTFIYFRF